MTPIVVPAAPAVIRHRSLTVSDSEPVDSSNLRIHPLASPRTCFAVLSPFASLICATQLGNEVVELLIRGGPQVSVAALNCKQHLGDFACAAVPAQAWRLAATQRKPAILRRVVRDREARALHGHWRRRVFQRRRGCLQTHTAIEETMMHAEN